MQDTQKDLWLFGYGSLIWRPPPKYDKRLIGYIQGYVRRFWQASEDHRGTPEAPGRVVTLITRSHWATLNDVHTQAPERTWGAAYRIPAAHVREVRDALDLREINGYSAEYTTFYSASASDDETEIECLVYIGLPDNPQFVGPQDPTALAAHILASKGPSGENRDYLYRLADSLDGIAKQACQQGVWEVDEHVTDLASKARSLQAESNRS